MNMPDSTDTTSTPERTVPGEQRSEPLTPEQRALAERNNQLLREAIQRGGREEFDRVRRELYPEQYQGAPTSQSEHSAWMNELRESYSEGRLGDFHEMLAAEPQVGRANTDETSPPVSSRP